MDIIKTAFALLTMLLLTGCGGGNSNSSNNYSAADIIFPEHLPKTNPNLSQENQSGIWMVYRITTENLEYTNDDQVAVTIENEIIANELSSIPEKGNYIYSPHDCTSSKFSEDQGTYIYERTNTGYTKLFNSNGAGEYGSAGRIDVYYLNSQKMHGKGWRASSISSDSREVIEFFAVKVSDEPNFSLSDDLDFSGTLYSDSDGETKFYDPACIGLQEHNLSISSDGKEIDTQQTLFFQQHGSYSHSFEVYKGTATNTQYNQVIGVQRRGFYSSIDHHCRASEVECLASLSLQAEILQNNASGISFTAKLTGSEDLNNEVYIDTQVSAIIISTETTNTSQQ
ncbi:MAG: hypothetical protein ACI9OH_000067 [Oleispira sp.]|jgi:hypothetical protein